MGLEKFPPVVLTFASIRFDWFAGWNLDSVFTYRQNAWLSWMLPILMFEVILKRINFPRTDLPNLNPGNAVSSPANRAPKQLEPE